MAVKDYSSNVFINCPFDQDFKDLFYAIIFSVFDCGFRARCALEEEDAGEVRIIKINNISGRFYQSPLINPALVLIVFRLVDRLLWQIVSAKGVIMRRFVDNFFK